MDRQKTFPIPPEIVNEVMVMHTTMKDLGKQIAYLEDKKRFNHAKMWDLINDKVPEARGTNCSIDPEKKTLTVNKKSGAEKGFKKFMEAMTPDDEDE